VKLLAKLVYIRYIKTPRSLKKGRRYYKLVLKIQKLQKKNKNRLKHRLKRKENSVKKNLDQHLPWSNHWAYPAQYSQKEASYSS